jgi:hypothetical protein
MAANDFPVVTLAAEVKGHVGLIGTDQDAPKEVKTHRDHFIYSKIAEHHGRIVTETDDLLFIEFESPTESVMCAADLQRGIIDHNIGMSRDQWIAFRIGVAMDEVERDSDDLIVSAVAALPTDTLATLIKPGPGIFQHRRNIAEWLATFAGPSGICISGAVRDAIGDQLPYVFEQIVVAKIDVRTAPVRCYAMRPSTAAPGLLGRQIPYSRPIRLRSAAIAASVFATIGWGIALWACLGTNASKVPIPAAVTADSDRPSVGTTPNGAFVAGSALELRPVSAAGDKASQVPSSQPNPFEIGAAVVRAERPRLMWQIGPPSSMPRVERIPALLLPQTTRDSGITGVGVFQGSPFLQTALDRQGATDSSSGTYWLQLVRNKSEWYETRRRSTEPSR